MSTRRLAVLGSPIAHSLSPALHRAAYAVLGLDWSYDAVEVVEGSLGAYLDTLDDSWIGLSLTMPLKREVLPLLRERSETVALVGGANTLLLDGMRGYNTDVDGVVGALADHGITAVRSTHILGMGATAASVLAAVARIGATTVVVTGRRADDVPLSRLASRLGVAVRFRTPGAPVEPVDLLVNTIPVTVDDRPEVDEAGAFLEVIYSGWPSPRAARWTAEGRIVVSGLEMLLRQAVVQVRIFVAEDEGVPVAGEAGVVAAMRAAVGL